MIVRLLITAMAVLMCWIPSRALLAQVPADAASRPDLRAVYFPESPSSGDWRVSLGFLLTRPAKEITEEVAVRAPAIDIHALYGLPHGFAVDGRVLSQILQNHFSAGPRWGYGFGRFRVGAGYDVAWWFGSLEVGGFDTRAQGWNNYPSVTLGYDLGYVQVSLRGEAILALSMKSRVGEETVTNALDTFSGMSFALFIEQPFWKNTSMTLGFRATYTKFHWEMWSLYSTFDRYLFYPEAIIGFML